jgi:hypothetical protein
VVQFENPRAWQSGVSCGKLVSMPKNKKRPSRKSVPETLQSKRARINNAPSQKQREHNEREDFSQAAARIVKEATEEH